MDKLEAPLSDGEIRIVTLFPAIDFETEIRCTLERAPLETGSYDALSYVCGNPNPQKTISVNNITIGVSPNLFVALRGVRHASETIRLWIDALSINQEDNVEKSAQVKRMGDIFANAAVVLMWLGKEEEESNLAMEFLQRMEMDSKSNVAEQYQNTAFEPHWSALGRLLGRPYWKRKWIIQEIVSAREGIICCGSSRASWDGLWKCLIHESLQGSNISRISNVARAMSFSSSYITPLARIRLEILAGEKIPFLEALISFSYRFVTDPRDNIFAILSMVIHKGFEPDYQKPTHIVYKDLVRHMIKMDQNLDILSACKGAKYQSSMLQIQCLREFADSANKLALLQDPEGRDISNEGLLKEIILNVQDSRERLAQCVGAESDPQAEASETKQTDDAKEQTDDKDEQMDEMDDEDEQRDDSDWETDDEDDMSIKYSSSSPRSLGNVNTHLSEGTSPNIAELRGSCMKVLAIASELIMPSWVPDWKTVPQMEYTHLLLRRPRNCHYRSGGSRLSCYFPDDEDLIVVDGVRIGSVQNLGFSSFHDNERETKEWKLWYEGSHPRDVYGDQKHQQEAFLRTLIAARLEDGSEGTFDWTIPFLNEAWGLGFVGNSQFEEFMDSTPQGVTDQIYGTANTITEAQHLRVKFISGGFRFCITDTGFMGCVPDETMQDDIVAVFLGGKVPFVLRKYEKEEGYFLVGECCKFLNNSRKPNELILE